MEHAPWKLPHGICAMEVTSWNLRHRRYQVALTPWMLPSGPYAVQVTS